MYRRLMGMAGATALTVGGLGAVLATGGTAFAAPPSVTSNAYLVGTALSGVSFSTTSSVQGKTANYSFTFVMPSGVGSTTTVALADLPSKTSASSLPTTALVTNTSTGSAGSVNLTAGSTSNSGSLVISDPVAGDTYTVALDDVTNSNSTTTISPTITVNSAAFGTASQVTLTSSTTTTTDTAAATSTTPGAGGVTDTFSDFTLGSASGDGVSAGNDLYLSLSAYDQTFPTGTSAYTVSVDSNGTTTTDAVSGQPTFAAPSTTGGPYVLAIPVTNAIAAGATVSVTIADITNGNGLSAPISPTTTYVVLGNAATATAPTEATTGAASFLTPSLGTLNLSVSPATQGSTATLTETFTTPVAGGSGVDVNTVFSGGTTSVGATSWAVFDSTNPLGDSNGTGSTPSLNSNVASGDSITVDYYGVTNSGSSEAVTTTVDGYVSTSNSVNLTTTSSSLPTQVMLSNSTPGVDSTYTISGLQVPSEGIPAAETTQTDEIEIVANPASSNNVVFPTDPADYTLTDLTNGASSGVTGVTAASGGGVYIENTNALAAGDQIQITINDAINPSSAADDYTLTANNLVEATQAVTTTVPTAAMTYPNGALIQSGGQIDVVAGGYAFGIPTPAVLNKITMMDHSGVVKGSFPTATMPAPGTLINPVGTSGYWVVGTNGEIYQFSSMSQFMKDGYVASQVIPVPNAGGLTAGAGAPPTAAATMANGALVQFGSTVYEYAGGVPTGIQTPAQLASIQKMTGAMVVMGSGSTPTPATTSANGTLVQPLGKAGIWVSDGGTLYQFMSASQFMTDGYSFQYVLPVATVGSYMTSSI